MSILFSGAVNLSRLEWTYNENIIQIENTRESWSELE